MLVDNNRHRARFAQTGGGLACLASLALFMACGESSQSVPAASPPLDPNPAPMIGVQEQRPARVVLPQDYSIEQRYPLVIMLHGYGANAAEQDFIFHLAQRTTAYQFILVLPNGTPDIEGNLFWDATSECCNFYGHAPVDDVGYLAALMKEALTIYAVDPKRIRLVGHSNGGYMSYRYICDHPVAVDRIAVLAGSVSLDPASCHDPTPVDVLHMQGTADDTVPYEPNLPPNGDPTKLYTVGAEGAVGRWAHVAGCDDQPDLVESRDYFGALMVDGNSAETEIYRYRGCTTGKRIELWTSIGADHTFVVPPVNDHWHDAVAAFLSE
jgi:polyhydroxybutyrate depolymerase